MPDLTPLLFDALRARDKLKWKAAAAGTGIAALAAPAGVLGAGEVAAGLAAAGVGLTTAVTGWWWGRHVMMPGSTKRIIERREEYVESQGGVASRIDIAQYVGPWALRQKADKIRPKAYGYISRRQRHRIPLSELGVEVVRLGLGWWGERVYASCEDVTLRIGGPRKGKTGGLACYGLDAPGALITTSTRRDLAEWVHSARADRPVHIYNPSAMQPIPSTVEWSILVGCEDHQTALRRAQDMLPDGLVVGDAARWVAEGRELLALLFHAAALSGRRAIDVLSWLADNGKRGSDQEVYEALSRAPHGAAELIEQARAHFEITEKTRSGVAFAAKAAMHWVADPVARRIGDAPRNKITFDPVKFIQNRETLHVLGHEQSSMIAPLNAAFVGEIAHVGRVMAADERYGVSAEGRLDPPLTILLDEAALSCPVPLPEWTSDFGGSGITLHISLQSLAQLRATWGDNGAGIILGNAGFLIINGGGNDASDLSEMATLVGDARFRNKGEAFEAADSHRWTQVMPPREIRALPTGWALVLPKDTRAVVGKVPQVWQRGVKRVKLVPPTPDTVPADLPATNERHATKQEVNE